MIGGRASAAALLAGLALLRGGGLLHAQEYLVMGTPAVNLRTGPGTDFVIVGKAEKGDLFSVAGQTDEWWEVRMFCEASRYVSKSVRAYPLAASEVVPQHGLALPESLEQRRLMRRSVLAGMARAGREAEELLPLSVDAARHEALREVMEDRILLEMFHVLGLQPAAFDDLMEEGRLW